MDVRLPLSAPRSRPSGGDRERVARHLRRACESDRLSLETFVTRLDVLYASRTQEELDRLVGDIPERGPGRRAILALVGWCSGWAADVAAAWRAPRMARLVLPTRDRVVIGRSQAADFVVTDPTVSARHAILAHGDGRWSLRDTGSTNGTYVNGWRVIDEIEVRPGDELIFGGARFVLAPPPAAARTPN